MLAPSGLILSKEGIHLSREQLLSSLRYGFNEQAAGGARAQLHATTHSRASDIMREFKRSALLHCLC